MVDSRSGIDKAAPHSDGAAPSNPWIALRGVSRTFGEVQANRRVDLDIFRGEVLALLGENGAGKSTLMATLSGIQRPDEGTIYIDGEATEFDSPRSALASGIGMVHQHFRLLEGLTVAENLFVGWSGIADVYGGKRALIARAREISEQFDLRVDPGAEVWQLSVGEKQRVEILRMLIRDVDLLILDEPTAVLTEIEAEQLFRLINQLKERDKSVVFISHKLNEVFQIADRITVMRAGEKVAELIPSASNVKDVSRIMVGAEVSRSERKRKVGTDPVLSCRDIEALDDQGAVALAGVSLTIRSGEIVGIAGVAGNGQRELTEVLTGTRAWSAGEVEIAGRKIRHADPRAMAGAGLGIVPEERKGTGLAPGLPIWQNAILRRYRESPISNRGVVSKRAAKDFARGLAENVKLSTRDVNTLAGNLSGGHAQRLLVGREMDMATRALVLAYPSRGLDVAAVENVRTAAFAAREKGLGILVISEDLDEVFDLSDRIAVLYEGRVVGEFTAAEADRSRVGELMAGLHIDSKAGVDG